MQGNNLESILEKAKEHKKNYEWLEAAEYYKRASKFTLEKNNLEKTGELSDLIGYCYFRAGLQSETKSIFKERMESSIKSYMNSIRFFQDSKSTDVLVKAENAKANVSYVKSWLEIEVSKKKMFLDEWWKTKSKILKIYEKEGNNLALAKTCNDMLEGSADCRCWLAKNWEETIEKKEKLITLGERAIEILAKEKDIHQLARAYCWTSWHSFIGAVGEEIEETFRRNALNYSKKALELSREIDDAWLMGWSYDSLGRGQIQENEISSALKCFELQIMKGNITRDKYLSGVGKFLLVMLGIVSTFNTEDPDENRKIIERNVQVGEEVIDQFQLINLRVYNSYYTSSISFIRLASIELNYEKKLEKLRKAVEYGQKSVEEIQGFVSSIIPNILNGYSWALYELSEVEHKISEKRLLLNKVIGNTERSTKFFRKYPYNYFFKAYNQTWIALANLALSRITKNKKEKISLLKQSITAIKIGIKIIEKDLKINPKMWKNIRYGQFFYYFGAIYLELYVLKKEKNLLTSALESYKESAVLFKKQDLITRLAESYWQVAKIHNKLESHIESAKYYEKAAKKYLKSAEKIVQLKEFYKNHSYYMLAWSQIEKARYNHSKEDYAKAMEFYQEAAFLHEKSKSWSYLGSNYYAWVQLEKGEDLSRNEKPLEAIQSFQLATEYFNTTIFSINKKLKSNILESKEEKNQASDLIKACDLRSRYCQARMNLEEAKIIERKGDYAQSSRTYNKAAKILNSVIDELDSEEEKKEFRLIKILSQAWEKMTIAEEQDSPEIYLEAAQIFEQAKANSVTKKTTLLVLGNSSFCKGIAAGIRYQRSLDLSEHSTAKSHLQTAANNYLQAGFTRASEYSKACLRLFDAYVFINQAESELDQEKRAKQFQMIENLLQLSVGSFMKAKQPEKIMQVKQILENVKEEKKLAISLNQILEAPSIVSTTMSFATPTPTSEASVGLDNFEHANVQANLITNIKEVKVGQSFCLSVEFVNAGREPALLMRVEEFVPTDFVVVKKPEIYRIEDTTLNMKGKQIAPLKLVEVKLTLQPSKKGAYSLNPRVHYLDERGQNKTLQLKTVEINVKELILEDRVSTGTSELDSLLLGGIPKEYAVVLSGSPCDEREMIVKNFLKAGAKEEITFYVATEAAGLEGLLEKPNFYLFLCNPKPKTEVPDLPNVFRLQGKADITNLGIALTKAIRTIDPSVTKKRVCIEILSDALMTHGPRTTREWLSGLITDLGAKGFTMLAVIDPTMHSSEQANAVINLFDGEISITQSDDPLDCKKSIHVKKLRNQDYIKNPICLIEMKNQ